MSDNTPTREQVQQALDYVAGQYADSGQHMSRDMEDIFAAARLWLEAPIDEMIERAAEVIADETPSTYSQKRVFEIAERVLRAALEMEHE